MDRFEKKITGAFIAAWIASAILSLGLLGVGIWGIISLVNWVTSQNF